MDSFGARLAARQQEFGPLCLGIDPSERVLADWGFADTPQGARDFGYHLITAAEGRVGIVKPQVAFFERFGSGGFFALEEVMEAAREAKLMVIADAKRGDVGSTMLGYAQAWFGDDSPLRADALTLSPHLGPSSLAETMEYARDVKGGIFLLAATSNPEASELQGAKRGGKTVSALVLEAAQKLSAGDCGVVIGATADLELHGIADLRTKDIGIPILAPGFGAQGVALDQLESIFGASSSRVICNVSRAAYSAGPSGIKKVIDTLKSQL